MKVRHRLAEEERCCKQCEPGEVLDGRHGGNRLRELSLNVEHFSDESRLKTMYDNASSMREEQRAQQIVHGYIGLGLVSHSCT